MQHTIQSSERRPFISQPNRALQRTAAMPTPPYTPEEERESQLLRASVVEAAMTLGPQVTGWMFQNTVTEEEEEDDRDQVLTPGLVSSSSSEDSHSLVFSSQDGHTQTYTNTSATSTTVSRSGSGSRPPISFPGRLAPVPKTTLENGFYLDSPFVVVDEGNFPRYPDSPPWVSTSDIPLPPVKKPTKGFRFTTKKRTLAIASSAPPASQSKALAISAPLQPAPGLDDPVAPSAAPTLDSPTSSPSAAEPRASTPSSTSPSSTARSTPTKLRKHERPRDWDFKDADRPSFFEQPQPLPQPNRGEAGKAGKGFKIGKGRAGAKKAGDEDDAGYASEGTGRRVKEKRKEKEKDAAKDKGALKRSVTSRLMSKWSSSDLREPVPPVPRPPAPPLPIHDRFAGKASDAHEAVTTPSPTSNNSPYLTVNTNGNANGNSVEPSPASSASSFTLMPDLNAAKRLGLNKYASGLSEGGVVGSDNKMKLAMLAKLITEPPAHASSSTSPPAFKPIAAPVPAIEIQSPSDKGHHAVELRTEQPLPSSGFIVPSPTFPRNTASPTPSLPPSVLRYYDPPPSRAASATPSLISTQGHVRGRQAPFPVRPIHPTPPRPRAVPPHTQVRFLVPPQRYMDVDVPRSVRSSYSKDLEREESGDREEDDRSMYSDLRGVDDDAGSRASFMDVTKSEEAREKLVKGVGVAVGKGGGWF